MSPNIKVLSSELKMPLLKLPIKMVLAKVGGRGVLISPLPRFKNYLKEVNEFFQVTDIVAPNLYHHLGVQEALVTFPSCRVWGVEGFREKRNDIQWTHLLSEETWNEIEEFSVYEVRGMPDFNECVFFHRKSKTLIVSDLCFNHINGSGFGYWLIFSLFGTYKRFAVSKLFLKKVKNKNQFEKSIKRILNLDFENIILPHGENVIGNGKVLLKTAFEEHGFKF